MNIGNLAVGASATSTILVDVASTASNTITNTAKVSGNQPDPNLANNTASATTQVNVPVRSAIVPRAEDRQDRGTQSGSRRLDPDLHAGREQQFAHGGQRT